MIRILIVLSALAILASCSKETADYKKYFSPTAQDGKTRYLVFSEQTESNGDTFYTKAVRRSEKINDSTLVFVEYTCYEDTCVRADSTLMVIREDGVYNKESYVGKENGWVQLKDLSTSITVPWEWEIEREVSMNWTYEVDGFPSMTLKTTRKFTGFEDVTLEGGEKVKAAVRKDVQHRTVGDEKKKIEVTIWDVPDFGLYRYESNDGDRDYLMVFRKEINEDEYKEMLGR